MKNFDRAGWVFAIIGGILTATTACAQGENPATKAMPRSKGWVNRHNGFVAVAKKGNVDVLFLGDSITDAWRGRAASETWNKYFKPVKSANFGISGDQTQHVLWRLENGELEGISPKVAVLMIGTNNVPRRHTPEQIAAGVTKIIETIHAKSPKTKVLLLAIFPRSASPKAAFRVTINKTNEMLAKLDKREYVRYLDIGKSFLQKDGTLTKEIMPDLLHLSKKGYQIWGDSIAPTVYEMLGRKAGGVRKLESRAVQKVKVDIRGKVTKILKAKGGDRIGRVLIKGKKTPDTRYGIAYVSITKTTKIYIVKGDEKAAAKFTDIRQDSTVQATFTGPVAESFPVQATAQTLLILSK